LSAETPLDDAELVAAFEKALLPPEKWNHRAHVRVAFVYARQFGLETAVARMRSGLLALNAAHQVPDAVDRGYHETITVAFLRLIHAACQQPRDPRLRVGLPGEEAAGKGQAFATSAEFCGAHPELMTKEALLAYYSRDRLKSSTAKAAFVEPDLRPLP
jgi:hypothetical protein